MSVVLGASRWPSRAFALGLVFAATLLCRPLMAALTWEKLDALADVRYEGARDISGDVQAGHGSFALPGVLSIDGTLYDTVQVGVGSITFARKGTFSTLDVDGTVTPQESTSFGPTVDALAGAGVTLNGRVLAVSDVAGIAIRWTRLEMGSLGAATVEVFIDRSGTVTIQYLALPANIVSVLGSGSVHAGSTLVAGSAGLEPRGATAFRLRQNVLQRLPLPPRVPNQSGPPPNACRPAVGTWCDVADGPGSALTFLNEGFDDGLSASRGWVGTSEWHDIPYTRCTPGASTNPGRSWYFGRNASCTYADSDTGTLSSPLVGPVTANTVLLFTTRIAKEEGLFGPYDFADVYVNGTLIASFGSPPDPNAWYNVNPLPLSDWPNYDFTGQMVNVQFVFTSDGSVHDLGWMVDDVLMYDPNGANAGCVINAGHAGTAPCSQRQASDWFFNEGDYCAGCTYTFYAIVECGREMHLPLDDMEGADITITNVVTGAPVSLRCVNQTARADAGQGSYPQGVVADCCGSPAPEVWWGPPFDVTDNMGVGHVGWGFPGCPNLTAYDFNGDGGVDCTELSPPCGGQLSLLSPGEAQGMDCFIADDAGLCGIYRVDVTSGGFVWHLFANCDGNTRPQFPIFLDCTEAWTAYNPLPELAVANVRASGTCPNLTVQFDLQDIGCVDYLGDVTVRLTSNCLPPDSQDVTIPGPIRAGSSVPASVPFNTSCAPVTVQVIVDPNNTIPECTESPTAAACRAAAGVDSLSVDACPCVGATGSPPSNQTICAGGSANLDASSMTITPCAGTIDYVWSDSTGNVVGRTARVSVSPATTETYSVRVSCSTDPTCAGSAIVTVTVQNPPIFTTGQSVDFARCNLGVEVSWSPATFRDPTGTGVYNIYKSTVSCADALSQPPAIMGLSSSPWVDRGTTNGGTYYYVIEAEDNRGATSCLPRGPHNGGMVTRVCLPPVIDTSGTTVPAGVFATLRASHVGDAVTMNWTLARVLLSDEHFHLQKAVLRADSTYSRVTPDGDLTRSHVETDTSAWIQFFDLRVADACETESLREYPPGLP